MKKLGLTLFSFFLSFSFFAQQIGDFQKLKKEKNNTFEGPMPSLHRKLFETRANSFRDFYKMEMEKYEDLNKIKSKKRIK